MAGFKQECPSCEAQVPIRDASLVGKKVACPQCKYQFVVVKPKDSPEKPAGKPGKPGKPGAAARGPIRPPGPEDDPYGLEQGKKKRMTMGLALGGVGLLVLAAASYFILFKPSTPKRDVPRPINPGVIQPVDPEDPNKQDPKTDEKPVTPEVKAPIESPQTTVPGTELTNLLPGDTEHLFHGFFKDLFDYTSPFRTAAFTENGTFLEKWAREKIGFSPLDIDDLIRAERFSDPAWTYTVVHFKEPLDPKAPIAALHLKKAPPVGEHTYYEATKPNPWFERMAQVAVGVPQELRALAPQGPRTMCVYFHDAQTVIFADEGPLKQFLKNGKKFPVKSSATPSTPVVGAPAGGPVINLADTEWEGTENRATPPTKLKIQFGSGGSCTIETASGTVNGKFEQTGAKVTVEVDENTTYFGSVAGMSLAGNGKEKGTLWKFAIKKRDPVVVAPPPPAENRDVLTYTIWDGNEVLANGKFSKVRIEFHADKVVRVLRPANVVRVGSYAINSNQISMRFSQTSGMDGTWTPDNLSMSGGTYEEAETRKFVVKKTSELPKAIGPGGQIVAPKKTKDVAVEPAPELSFRTGAYLTIDPSLKDALDRLEALTADSTEKLFYSTATRADAARLPTSDPERKDRRLWQPRQVWDMTSLFDDRKPPRIKVVGSSLVRKEPRVFQHRTEFECPQENDARDLHRIVDERFAPEVARWVKQLVGAKVWLPSDEVPEGEDPEKTSRWTSAIREQSVDVKVDLHLDAGGMDRARTTAVFFALGNRTDVDVFAESGQLHGLARAAGKLGNVGSPEHKAPAGGFPPGTMRRAEGSKAANTPYSRLSWMTALLPHLGHDNLYRRIAFDHSWRDPDNWLAARTLVPQFVDPRYPDVSRYADVPGLGVAPAATHFVGVAGVGLDAAEYQFGDVAAVGKRGVFGYDRAATLAEIQKGLGASNTILMLQVPHDGLTGVSPWMAGGGSTVRGVPDKNSIAPFVLSNDRHGKPITHNGKRGTNAVMVDGSVRFVDETIPDDIFKALCTVQGRLPEKLDFFQEEMTHPIAPPASAAPVVATPPVLKAPVLKTPEVKTPDAKAPETKAAPEVAPPPMKVESKK